jgi:hypothetical protein
MKIVTPLVAALLLTSGIAVALPSAQGPTATGEVLEVRSVQTYTYLRLKTREGEIWAAVPSAGVKKGDQVTLVDTMVMENFESKGLKTKFDRIVFGSLKSDAKIAGTGNPHGAPAAAPKPVAKIAKATGADARTVAEVIAGKSALKDKNVTIRGQVMKASSGILGKNWIHLQDGSGSSTNGTHDIVVTTTEAASVGEIVSASGVVRTGIDLGSGYVYAVLVEGAKLRK